MYGCLNLEAANGEQQRARLCKGLFSYAHPKEYRICCWKMA
ncbi:MAG: hypothetical protein K0S67_2124 [Nitrososphaeraceae archaeon]|jgi:hypothetical protein|nr:hypothetical protein [Nitrososphaeraceae archaeon]